MFRPASVFAFALVLISVSPAIGAIIGPDDRRSVPTRLQNLSRGVGSIITQGTRSGCSAFCVSDNLAATAAHCLIGRDLNKTAFTFANGGNGNSGPSSLIAGSDRNLASSHVVFGIRKLRERAPINVGSDWALFRLAKPVCRGREFPGIDYSTLGARPGGWTSRSFLLAKHAKFRKGLVSYSGNCKIGEPDTKLEGEFENPSLVLLHTCDTGGGTSGAPILIDGPRGLTVVGINNGVFKQEGPDKKVQTLLNTGSWAKAFRKLIYPVSSARIEVEQDGIDAIRIYLIEKGAEGLADAGPFDDALRAAIESFQRESGLLVTGLPEQRLLNRLENSRKKRRRKRRRSRRNRQ